MFIQRVLKKIMSKSIQSASVSPVMDCESMESRTLLSGGAWTRLDLAASGQLAASVVTASPTAGSQKVTPLARRSPIPFQKPPWIGNFAGTLNNALATPFILSILSVGKSSAVIAFAGGDFGTVIMQGKATVNFGDVVLGKNATIMMSQAGVGTVSAIRLTYNARIGDITGFVFVSASKNSGTFVVF